MKLKLVGTTLLKINERKIGNEGIGYIDILDLMLMIYYYIEYKWQICQIFILIDWSSMG